MARPIPPDRLQQLVDAAAATFIAHGYRQAQMSDVANRLGVAKGTLYRYVESKEALLDAVIRYADGHEPLPAIEALPLSTQSLDATLDRLRARIAKEASGLRLLTVLEVERCDDVRTELTEVLNDLYQRAYRNRFAIKVVDRCAGDHPALAEMWFGQGRWAQHTLLTQYLEKRIKTGQLKAISSIPIAARLLLETVAFWAVHRHWDPAPQPVEDEQAEHAVVQLLVQSVT